MYVGLTHRFHPSILREYDIRGVVGTTLGADDARAIGRAFAARMRAAGGGKVAVAYDGRLSSPMLEAALVEGLVAGGVDVVRIGMGPTPMLYYAEASAEDVQGGIQVTGSHNPRDHNGFKMVMRGLPFFGADIRALAQASPPAELQLGATKPRGVVTSREVLPAYIDRLLQALAGIDPGRLAGLRIGWDAGNGATGPALEALVAQMSAEEKRSGTALMQQLRSNASSGGTTINPVPA